MGKGWVRARVGPEQGLGPGKGRAQDVPQTCTGRAEQVTYEQFPTGILLLAHFDMGKGGNLHGEGLVSRENQLICPRVWHSKGCGVAKCMHVTYTFAKTAAQVVVRLLFDQPQPQPPPRRKHP